MEIKIGITQSNRELSVSLDEVTDSEAFLTEITTQLAEQPVLKLAESRKNGTLERLLRDLRSLDLLILDEWGYVPVDKDGSQLLFRVISDSYESKSLILTTNLEFSKWGGIFTDDQMAAAMIDRLVHHGHLLIFEGKSYRMEHALMRQDA